MRIIRLFLLVSYAFFCLMTSQPALAATLSEVQSFTVTGGISQAVFSDQYNLLFLRDSGTDIRVFDTTTQTQISLRNRNSSSSSFTDLHLSPSGRYLYAADYGGTNIGYGSPSTPSYVHRFDLQTRTWTMAAAPGIAYRIEPVDDNRVLLQEIDQWVDMTLNTYDPASMSKLTSVGVGYSGDIEYDYRAGRIYHTETGISSTDITAWNLSGNTISLAQTRTGSSYSSYRPVLSADGARLYVGPVEVQAGDITTSVTTFSEAIGAACRNFAFGTTHYYDPNTGTQLGTFSYSPAAYALGANARDIWVVQQPSGGSATLHRYSIQGVPEPATFYWNFAGGGSWTNAANWRPSGIPDGVDNTADLSQASLTDDAVVTLDGDRTIGNVVFGDASASHNWTLNAGTGGTLTLQLTSGSPTINVANQTATINAVIAGGQGLRKTGSGKLVLGANNAYTGGTTISGGILAVASDANLGSGEVTINAGTLETTASINSARNIVLGNAAATIQVDSSCTYTAIAGASISGSGGLTKTGDGTLDLTTATLSYSGPTTVSGGMLNTVGFNTTALLTVAAGASANVSGKNLMLGSVTNSGTVNFTAASGTTTLATLSGTGSTNFAADANISTFSGGIATVNGSAAITNATGGTANLWGSAASISNLGNAAVNLGFGTALSVSSGTQTTGSITGLGSLTKMGSGTLVLASSNAWGGGTTIAAGTLQIGNGSTTGSIFGDVANNAALVFNRADDYAFAGGISGNGSVTKSGAGVLTFTANNTYTGGTTISNGTLQLGNGMLAGSISGNVTNNGVLAFNTPLAGQTYAGKISGPGSVVKSGPGTQILTGDSTYSGGTTILQGVLQIGNGATPGNIVGNVNNSAALVFNRADNFTFSGVISGTGNVIQAGSGTLTLTGSVSNSVTASAGRVVLGSTGAITGSLTTGSAGRVENAGGTLHVVNVDNAGTLIGNAEVYGSLLNRPTGHLKIGGGQRFLIQGAAAQANAGLLEVIGNPTYPAEFESVGPLTNAPGGSTMITARNAALRFNGGLTNQAAVAFSYGNSDVFGKINNASAGQIVIAGGAGVTFYDDVTQNGSLVVSAVGSTHSSAVFFGNFTGAGGFTGGGDVFLMGDLRPGNSPAEVTYGGNVFLVGSTKTVMEVGGTVAGSQYDKINITGELALGGQLDIELINNFTPKLNDTFDLFDGSLSGEFDSVSLPLLSGGLHWDLGNLYANGSITVVPEPSAFILIATGILGLMGYGLRRRNRVP